MSEKTAFKVDQNTLLRYLIGGSLVGAGAATATSLANQLRVISERRKAKQDTSYDDDTLYVNVPEPVKRAFQLDRSGESAGSAATLSTSLIAALLGGIGSYNFIRNRYNQKRKKELQQELDQAQNLYLGTLQQKKMASQFGNMSKVTGTVGTLLLLSALGAAATTNKVLSHYFPGYEVSKALKPKRMVIRKTKQPGGQMEKKDESAKQVQAFSPGDLENILQLKAAASGNYGEVDGVVRAIAERGLDSVKQALVSSDVDSMFSLTKSAGVTRPVNHYHLKLAAAALCHDPLLGQALAPVIAADVYELMPSFCKVATQQDKELSDTCKTAFELVSECAASDDWEKVANRVIDMAVEEGVEKTASQRKLVGLAEHALPQKAMLGLLLADFVNRKAEDLAEEPNTSNLTSAPSESGERSDAPKPVTSGEDVDDFIAQNPELLQAVLNASQE